MTSTCGRCIEGEGREVWAVRLTRIHAALDGRQIDDAASVARTIRELAVFCDECLETSILELAATRGDYDALRDRGASVDEARRMMCARLLGKAGAA